MRKMVGQKLIFEYSGYALHSGYANVYWSAFVRLGLLFPLPPRSRAVMHGFSSSPAHRGVVVAVAVIQTVTMVGRSS